jgi:uncharacterized membrane protein YidH (DUF202 family)
VDIALALGILAALLLLAAASEWLRLSRRIDRRKVDETPVVPVLALQSAASLTALALGLTAIALLAAGLARFW